MLTKIDSNLQRTTKHISKGYPQFLLTGPVPGPCRNGFRPKYNSDMASEMRSKPEAKKIHDCRTCEYVIKVRRYQGPV